MGVGRVLYVLQDYYHNITTLDVAVATIEPWQSFCAC